MGKHWPLMSKRFFSIPILSRPISANERCTILDTLQHHQEMLRADELVISLDLIKNKHAYNNQIHALLALKRYKEALEFPRTSN